MTIVDVPMDVDTALLVSQKLMMAIDSCKEDLSRAIEDDASEEEQDMIMDAEQCLRRIQGVYAAYEEDMRTMRYRIRTEIDTQNRYDIVMRQKVMYGLIDNTLYIRG